MWPGAVGPYASSVRWVYTWRSMTSARATRRSATSGAFPLDSLKIDASFVGDLTLDVGADGIIVAILAMAEVLELSVVAEGVETEDQADFLRTHGCGEMQGWLFSRALPAEEFETLIRHMDA